MKHQTVFKRLIAMLLAVCLVFGAVPATAFAVDNGSASARVAEAVNPNWAGNSAARL